MVGLNIMVLAGGLLEALESLEDFSHTSEDPIIAVLLEYLDRNSTHVTGKLDKLVISLCLNDFVQSW